MTLEEKFTKLCEHGRQIALLDSSKALLDWDQHTCMPTQAGSYRAEQLGLLASLAHARRTSPELGVLLGELMESPLASDTSTRTGCIIARMHHDYTRHVKLPAWLVEEIAQATSNAQNAWIEARRANDFKAFQPSLTHIVRLMREQADALGYVNSRYEPLLDEYEPGAKVEDVAATLRDLVGNLQKLQNEIMASSSPVSDACLHREFPVRKQARLARYVCKKIGFHFEQGNLSKSAHPFCSTMGPKDCRITSRYRKNSFGDAFFGALHEAGHGLYEQGLVADDFGLPTGQAVSLGVHESQSRMWENLVGRSFAFWKYFFPKVKALFPGALSDLTLESWFAAVNVVRPSFIRVEADEVTYNLHIVIRFELEKSLLEGDLSVGDLPHAWNEKYKRYLGMEPPNAALGVLQDVHWSAGLFGYFPTYSLGNIYASQLFGQAESELGDLSAMFEKGEFAPLRHWLLVNVHRQGRRYSPSELIEKTARRPLSSQELAQYLRRKLAPLYNL